MQDLIVSDLINRLTIGGKYEINLYVSITMSNGTEKTLKEYNGKPLIVVNTASKCGLTPQFKGLQELYEQYSDQGLEIIGFPCDQFNNQEYENIEETTQFCQINYIYFSHYNQN